MRNSIKSVVSAILLVIGPVYSAPDDDSQPGNVRTEQVGPSQYHVTCYESARYCAEEFQRVCPEGHKVEGYFRNEYDHGQITARISCTVLQEN